MCSAGEFLGGRTGFEFDGQRSSVYVVSASRYAEQHGLQPHRGLRRRCVDRHTQPLSYHPSRLHQATPWLYFDTVKTIMGFTTVTHSNVQRRQRDESSRSVGAARLPNREGMKQAPPMNGTRMRGQSSKFSVLAKCRTRLSVETVFLFF